MQLRHTSATAVLAILAGAASPASATIVDATYWGTVSGSDTGGAFGVIGSLTGDSYVARFTFDTSVARIITSPTENLADGGSCCGRPSPLLAASLTINGKTVTIDASVPQWESQIYGANNGTGSEQYHYISTANVVGGGVAGYLYDGISNTDASLPASIDTPFSYDVKPGDTIYGDFQYTYSVGGVAESASLTLDPARLTVSAGVPEPSTWALLALGFVGLGGAGRRQMAKRSAVLRPS